MPGLLPSAPDPPQVPPSPLEERRFTSGEGIEIRPFKGPEPALPDTREEEFRRRYDAWRAQTVGSIPEFIVWEFLVHIKKQIEGIDFSFQAPQFGGRTEFGGFVLDFYIVRPRYGWRVQGERFHSFFPQDRARDDVSKALLESRGIKILDLWEDDLLVRPIFVLEKAWNGEQVQNIRDVSG